MTDDRDIPSDNGRPATVDPATGAVHGSGMGAGGGQRGEDYNEEAETGAGFPRDGADDARTPAPLPPND